MWQTSAPDGSWTCPARSSPPFVSAKSQSGRPIRSARRASRSRCGNLSVVCQFILKTNLCQGRLGTNMWKVGNGHVSACRTRATLSPRLASRAQGGATAAAAPPPRRATRGARSGGGGGAAAAARVGDRNNLSRFLHSVRSFRSDPSGPELSELSDISDNSDNSDDSQKSTSSTRKRT